MTLWWYVVSLRHFEILRRTCLRQTRFGVPDFSSSPPKNHVCQVYKKREIYSLRLLSCFFFFFQLHSSQVSLTVRSRSAKYYYLLSMHKMYISPFLQVSSSPTKFFCVSLSQSVNCGSWDTTTQVNTPFLIFLCVCSHSATIKKLNWETGPVFTTLHSRIHVSSSVDDDEYLQQTLFLCPFFTKLSSFSLLSLLTKLIYVTKGRLSHHNIQNTCKKFSGKKSGIGAHFFWIK